MKSRPRLRRSSARRQPTSPVFGKRLIFLTLLVVTALTASASIAVSQDGGGAPVLPLAQQADLRYRGAFRLPRSAGSQSDFQYGARSLAFNQANNSLFVQGRNGFVAEIGIPALTTSANYHDLLQGAVIQPFAKVDDQGLSLQNNPADTFIRGLLVYGGQLIVSFVSYYDANYAQTTSHLVRPLTLSTTGQARGPFKVGSLLPGHVAGYMTSIPTEWQAALGGTALTGNFGLPIITRESWGPAAHAFDPGRLGTANPLPATPLVDYPDNARSLGPWDGQSDVWNSHSTFAGMAFVGGTRSVLFLGVHGTGSYCYGDGGAVRPSSSEPWCYDPESGDKGSHAYPYVYRIWAYDANDLSAVNRGLKKSWEPRPYGIWNFQLPMASKVHVIPSAAYDASSKRLFIVQGFGASDPAEGFPVVHVFQLGQDGPPKAPNHVRLLLN
jgi:hypothetical protein